MESQLEGKVCLVTGGTQGIGKSIAKALAQEGVKLSIVSRHKNDKAIKELKSNKVDIIQVLADVSKENDVRYMVDKTISHYGQIDLFVNNVAAHWDESTTNITTKKLYNTINTNLASCMWACRDISKHMIKNKSGSILIIGSTASFNPLPCEVSY